MAFFDKEVGTSRCGFDWFPSSMSSVDFLAVNPFLGGQSDSLPLVTPRRQKLSGRPLLPASHGVSFLDAVALKNSAEHAVYSKTTSDTDSGTTTTTTTAAERSVHSHVNKQKSLYKTELCRSWEERGRCPYGNKCQYAHGTEELRPVARHPKFKTEVCCTFVTTGTCPYGRRCRFIHKNVPITAVGKQVCDSSKKNESYISSANSITASSRRLPIFVKLARGGE